MNQSLPAQPGPPPDQLKIIVIDEGPINNISQRNAREVIVEVDDENHRPVAGAILVFSLPARGASGTFLNGGKVLSVVTDSSGRVPVTIQPNGVPGKFPMHVRATLGPKTGNLVISQNNPPVLRQHQGHPHMLLFSAIAAAAALGIGLGVYEETRGAAPQSTISAGGGVVGPPR